MSDKPVTTETELDEAIRAAKPGSLIAVDPDLFERLPKGRTGAAPVAAMGAELVSVKILKTQPDVVQLVLEVPGAFKDRALQIGNYVGFYFEGVAFMNPKAPE